LRDLCLEKIKAGTLKKKDSDAVVTEAELSKALNPRGMTEPAVCRSPRFGWSVIALVLNERNPAYCSRHSSGSWISGLYGACGLSSECLRVGFFG
jgi:hypothetical protein